MPRTVASGQAGHFFNNFLSVYKRYEKYSGKKENSLKAKKMMYPLGTGRQETIISYGGLSQLASGQP